MGNPLAEGVFGSMGLTLASVYLIPQRVMMWSEGITVFTEAPGKKALLKNLVLLKYCKADFVSYEYHDGRDFEKLKNLRGKLPVLFWTVDSAPEAENCKDACDNIIFENFLP